MEEPSFDEFLQVLADVNQPIPLEHLKLLSDLDARKLKLVAGSWEAISPSRRLALLEHCGQIAEEHFEFLFEALNRLALEDTESTVRVQAVHNLWECETPAIIPLLTGMLLGAEQEDEREAAAEALGQFVYLGELEDIGEPDKLEVEKALLQAIKHDPSRQVQRRVIESLGYSSRADVASLIEAFHASDSEQDKISAIIAMGRSADPVWNDIVLHALQDASPEIRMHAARAAGELEMKDAVEDLIEILSDINALNQAAAVWSLGQIGGERAREALLYFDEQNEDEVLAELLQESLDHLAFVNGGDDFLFLDLDKDRGIEF